jgi:hypothetical protein
LEEGRAWLELGKKASCGMFGPVLEASDGAVDKKASYGVFGPVLEASDGAVDKKASYGMFGPVLEASDALARSENLNLCSPAWIRRSRLQQW